MFKTHKSAHTCMFIYFFYSLLNAHMRKLGSVVFGSVLFMVLLNNGNKEKIVCKINLQQSLVKTNHFVPFGTFNVLSEMEMFVWTPSASPSLVQYFMAWVHTHTYALYHNKNIWYIFYTCVLYKHKHMYDTFFLSNILLSFYTRLDLFFFSSSSPFFVFFQVYDVRAKITCLWTIILDQTMLQSTKYYYMHKR